MRAIDDFLLTLLFVPDWFVTSKMIEKLDTVLSVDVNILFFYEDSYSIIF